MSELLRIEYVPLDEARRWDRNAKKHDLGGIVASIRRYGFRDAPILDATLEAIAAGNGRIEALCLMRDGGEPAPRGVAVSAKGTWWVPVQVGLDSPSVNEAQSFAIDHNNLTVAGGDLGPEATYRLWDQEDLAEVLQDLVAADAMPVTLDEDDLAALLETPPPAASTKHAAGGACVMAQCPECGAEFEVGG